jgi:FkbM family methyltransferase
LWIELVKDAEVIFDIGANTGVYSLIAKSLNSSARVYAFEPVKRVFQKLEENNRLNDFDIICIEAAASNSDGAAIIYDTSSEHIYSVTVNQNLNADDVKVIPTKIDVVRLDTIIEQEKVTKIDLIKIDVETHEAEVLEGMGEYLEKFNPIMLIEILNDEVGQKVEALVKNKNYSYFNLNEETGSIRRVNKITKSDYYNYLLCPENVARKFSDILSK